jgi:methyl-accepting chemotaxis protein
MEETIQETGALKEEVAFALPVLDVMGTQLRETASQIETAVVDVCCRFQSMVDRAKAGVTKASELLAGGERGNSNESIANLIEEAQQTIEALLQHTQQSARVSQNAIERINRVRSATDDITKSLAQLDDITIGNRLLAVNARIQAVYAGDRAAGFGGVANEIAVQARRSAEIVDLIRGVSTELRNVSQAALNDLESMAAEDRRALERSKLEVNRVLADFRRMDEYTRKFIAAMTQESAGVAEEISSAVRALQFQDRINQRMVHVVDELNTLRVSLGEHCKDVNIDGQEVARRLSNMYTMHEERRVIGTDESDLSEGDVELF